MVLSSLLPPHTPTSPGAIAVLRRLQARPLTLRTLASLQLVTWDLPPLPDGAPLLTQARFLLDKTLAGDPENAIPAYAAAITAGLEAPLLSVAAATARLHTGRGWLMEPRPVALPALRVREAMLLITAQDPGRSSVELERATKLAEFYALAHADDQDTQDPPNVEGLPPAVTRTHAAAAVTALMARLLGEFVLIRRHSGEARPGPFPTRGAE